jgi:hypothetical protein
MSLDFPNVPTVGQIFPSPAIAGVPLWRWDGTEWAPANVTPFTSAPVLRSYLAGLGLSTAGSSASFAVAPGVAADNANVDMLNNAVSVTKTTGAWAAGNNNGALDTGTIAVTTWYHVYLIKNPSNGAVDILISISATAPTLPSGYTEFRRIGAMLTNASSQWTLFHQNGDEFLWDVPFLDVNGVAVGTGGLIATLAAVPPGIEVWALFNAYMGSNAANTFCIFHALDQANQSAGTPSGNAQLFVQVANQGDGGQFAVRTNTARAIRAVSNATSQTCNVFVITEGWIDRRGRDA